MCDILCVTNRTLCEEDFLARIEKIAVNHPAGIILREKDLSAEDYEVLATQVIQICQKHNVPCILHNYVGVALNLNVPAIHLPMHILRELDTKQKTGFSVLGASCHSVEEALEAQKSGCTYITAGHIFATDCKKGLPGRGLKFLQEVCTAVDIPVYAIGGIAKENLRAVQETGAKGVCIMSGLMKSKNIREYFLDT